MLLSHAGDSDFKHLGCLLLSFSGYWSGAGSEDDHLEPKLVPIWDVGIINGGFTHCTTMPVPKCSFFFFFSKTV